MITKVFKPIVVQLVNRPLNHKWEACTEAIQLEMIKRKKVVI